MTSDTIDSDFLTFDQAPISPPVGFTYSHSGQSPFRRALIRSVEMMTGQPTLRRLYVDWVICDKRPGEPVFDAALRFVGNQQLVTHQGAARRFSARLRSRLMTVFAGAPRFSFA